MQLILPDGFHGEFRLVLDPEHGEEIPWRWGVYTYRIPATGVLRVSTFKPFEPWHFQSARFESGERIANAYEVDDLPLGDPRRQLFPVLIHGGGMGQTSNGPYEMTFFIGSFTDYREWSDSAPDQWR